MARAQAVIVALTANTSLGDSRTACAAARAGIVRPVPTDGMALEPDGEEVPVVGHAVPFVDGFQGEARLLALGVPALADLVEGAGFQEGEQVGLCLALPDLAARASAVEAPPPPSVKLVERLVLLSRAPVPPSLRETFPAGHAGFGLAVQAALELLGRRRAEACIVGAIDTHLDFLTLDALAAQRRLKTADQPVGVSPGEAAAFMLLASPESARRRKATVLAELQGVGVAREPRTGDDPPMGLGLASAIGELVTATGPLPPGETWFVTDQNGETPRATDWGTCLQRLAGTYQGLLPAATWHPAASFGETGAASGALAAQMAVTGFTRGYAPGRCAVIMSSSDDGQRTAVRIDRPR